MFTMKIEWIGPIDHQRFLINRGDKHYWSGHGWTPHIKTALLYASHQDACRQFGQLAEEHFRGCSIREFEVLTKVKVYSDKPFIVEELREYLSAVCTLVMTPSYRGHGPVEDSYTQVEISWDNLFEMEASQPCKHEQES